MFKEPVTPSIPFLCRKMIEFLSSHPLFVQPLIKDPVSNQPLQIGTWSLRPGLMTISDHLYCTVRPFYSDSISTSPDSSSVSTKYDPYDLGRQGYCKASYHLVVQYDYRTVGILQTQEAEVPVNSLIRPEQYGLVDFKSKRPITIQTHSGYEIIGQYLELTRLALQDFTHWYEFPFRTEPFEVLHCVLKTPPWETDRNVIDHTGYVLVKVDAYVARGWRDIFEVPVETFTFQELE